MEIVASRATHNFYLRRLASEPTPPYLIAKLHAAGSMIPDSIFHTAAYTELRRISVGWQRILDRVTLLSTGKAKTLPISVDQHFYR